MPNNMTIRKAVTDSFMTWPVLRTILRTLNMYNLVTLVLFRGIVEFHLDINTPPGLLLQELLVAGTER